MNIIDLINIEVKKTAQCLFLLQGLALPHEWVQSLDNRFVSIWRFITLELFILNIHINYWKKSGLKMMFLCR